MATVRFSKEFKDSILKRAREVFKSREKSVDDALPNKWGDKLYDAIFASHIPTLNNVPVEFLNMQSELRFGGDGCRQSAISIILYAVDYEATIPRR